MVNVARSHWSSITGYLHIVHSEQATGMCTAFSFQHSQCISNSAPHKWHLLVHWQKSFDRSWNRQLNHQWLIFCLYLSLWIICMMIKEEWDWGPPGAPITVTLSLIPPKLISSRNCDSMAVKSNWINSQHTKKLAHGYLISCPKDQPDHWGKHALVKFTKHRNAYYIKYSSNFNIDQHHLKK